MSIFRDLVAAIADFAGRFRSRGQPSSQPSCGLSERSKMRLEDEPELTAWFRDNESCPDCGGSDFIGGPRGGLSQNTSCADCGSEFNIARYEGRVLFVERIDRTSQSPGVVVVTHRNPRPMRVLH